MCMGRRWGKTVLGLHAVIVGHGNRIGALQGGTIWWIAPTYPIAQDIWRNLKHALAGAWSEKSETERRIVLPGGGSVTVKSADNPDGLRGAGLDGVVCDEAAFIQAEAWSEVLRPALSDKQGWAIFISTPKGLNWFHDLFKNATGEGWARWQAPTSQNPIVLQSELDAAKLEVHTLVFKQEYEAQFVTGGGSIFTEPARYETPNIAGAQIIIACDPAASEKTSADYSAIVVISSGGYGTDRTSDVLDVVRARMEIPKLVLKLIEVQAKWNAEVVIEAFGGFKGVPQSLRAINPRLRITEITPQGDKLTRALPVAAAWNAGRVRVPVQAPWLNDFMYEVMSFTGTKDDQHDDQVDALAHAFNAINDSGMALRIAAVNS